MQKPQKPDSDCYLMSEGVRRRYGGCSHMWLWRRVHAPGSTFPKPLRIGGRNFWKIKDLERWEAEQAAAQAERR